MAQLEEVKKILRSLLVSAPVKVTVSSLNKDYKSLEGNYIPFRELGYNSLLHLLHSIPDVLRVKGSSFEAEVALVINDKVAHVSDMVMKQKRPSKGKYARASQKSVICEPSKISSVKSHDSVESYHSKIYPKNMLNFAEYAAALAISSPNSTKSAFALSPFPKQLLSTNLKPPPSINRNSSQVGRSECISYIKSVDSIASKEHHSEMPNRTCDPKSYVVNTTQTAIDHERVPSLTKHMPQRVLEQTSIVKDNSEVNSKFQRLKLQRLKNNNIIQRSVLESHHSELMNGDYETASSYAEPEVRIFSFDMDNKKVPLHIQQKLKRLIKLYPFGILCMELPSLYEKKYFESLDYHKYGFDRLISLCFYLNNIFHCEAECDYDFRLFDKENIPVKRDTIDKELLSDNVKSRITAKTVDISKIKAEKSKDWEIYDSSIPKNAHKLGEVVEMNTLSEYPIGETIQIVISEIYNPGKFWIYRSNSNLNDMMNTMQNFYRENKTNLLIPEFLLEVGLFCVVNTLNEFQRALVVDLLDELGGYIKAYLIDYGTLTNLPRDKVWYLMKEFTNLPCQAVESELSDIEPKDSNMWSEKSIMRFKDMVTSKQVFAKILDKRGQVLSVHISVMKMPLKTLNDFLVDEGYAKYKSESESQEIDEISLSECNPRKKLIEKIRLKNRSYRMI